MDKILAKTLKILFQGLLIPLNLLVKIVIRHFSYFMMWNFMEKKKKLMIQRSGIPGKWEKE